MSLSNIEALPSQVPIAALPARVRIPVRDRPEMATAALRSLLDQRPALDDVAKLSPRLVEGHIDDGHVRLEIARRGAFDLRERNSFRVRLDGVIEGTPQSAFLSGEVGLAFDRFVTGIQLAIAAILGLVWISGAAVAIPALAAGDPRGAAALAVLTLIVFAFGSLVWMAIARSKRGAVADANALSAWLWAAVAGTGTGIGPEGDDDRDCPRRRRSGAGGLSDDRKGSAEAR
jgi:hypothetical protein